MDSAERATEIGQLAVASGLASPAHETAVDEVSVVASFVIVVVVAAVVAAAGKMGVMMERHPLA